MRLYGVGGDVLLRTRHGLLQTLFRDDEADAPHQTLEHQALDEHDVRRVARLVEEDLGVPYNDALATLVAQEDGARFKFALALEDVPLREPSPLYQPSEEPPVNDDPGDEADET